MTDQRAQERNLIRLEGGWYYKEKGGGTMAGPEECKKERTITGESAKAIAFIKEQATSKLKAELADICKRLRGIPGPDGSRLDGENGLAAAVMRAHDQYAAENKALRVLLWGTHPCKGKYGDDGELQCSKCMIDFKRDPTERIMEGLKQYNENTALRKAVGDERIMEAMEALAEIYNADFWGKLDVTGRLKQIASDLKKAREGIDGL